MFKIQWNFQVHVQNLRLDIWPGYITSIRQHEEDILVCAELSHKIMRSETILDIMRRIKTEDRDFKTAAQKQLLGMTVLTKYNNKTYRIDEITFDVKPSDTFKMRDEDISYIDYYKVSFFFFGINIIQNERFQSDLFTFTQIFFSTLHFSIIIFIVEKVQFTNS